MQQKPRIAFQGLAGAYSAIAAERLYPDCDMLHCATFAGALQEVDAGNAGRAVIPVTNEIAGPVTNALPPLRAGGYKVEKTLWLPIHHCLLGLPEAKLEDIRSVYSHWQALDQCRKNIARYNLKPVEAGDTAGAAKQIAAAGDVSKAALASAAAAAEYGLQILQEHFQDRADNQTLFLAVGLGCGGDAIEDVLKEYQL